MNRIYFGILLLLACRLICDSPAQAQNGLNRSEPRLVQRTYNSTSIESSPLVEATEVRTTTAGGNFPSLSPKQDAASGQRSRSSDKTPFSGSLVTVGSSLAVVLGLFAGLVWITRRFGAKTMGAGSLPNEVLQPLGSSPIDARTNLTLVRCGTKILVLARTASGVQPISEITEPNEVRHITALCSGDSKKEFASTLQAIEKEQTGPGYVGAASSTSQPTVSQGEASNPRSRGRLFATA
ncbi:MAG: flagellar biosynthetic protein FliO [Planctomycetota bacterium]